MAESLPRWVESAYTALQSVPLPTYTATGEQNRKTNAEKKKTVVVVVVGDDDDDE